jgi:dTDP-4-amino-4,6-dideoxygalactose transaminase
MINVTKPFLPPLEEYRRYLDHIWQRNWLTNNGPLVNELELKLKEYLQLPHLLFVTNGTIALQLAIKALDLKGEIITTPFSYVATTSSIVWEGCVPVFVDINPNTYNIDPSKIEDAITNKTSAILATHVFGNPCEVEVIEKIASKHHLKVIYDSAHGFGVVHQGKSLYAFGDISTGSFHATKLFHTVEGGAVVTSNPELLKKMAFMRNFGHNGPEDFATVGINGKNSEFHAAMGLAILPDIQNILAERARLVHHYRQQLAGLRVTYQQQAPHTHPNYSYFPILFASEEALLKAERMLNDNWIYPRRYFHPSLNELRYLQRCSQPISESISKRILCLPLFTGLSNEEIDLISRLLLRAQNN